MVLETIGKLLATKGLETVATEGVKTLFETHITPFLQNEADWNGKLYEVEDCIKEYLEITYKKAMIMNTIVFRGVNKTLCDLYLPLTLTRRMADGSSENICIDDSCVEKLTSYNKILIVDTAGMGKSTITKFLIVKQIADNKKIPILIELRKIKEKQGILEHIYEQFKLLEKNIEKDDVIKMLKRGDFVIFLDGYDEIANEQKSEILEDIQDFFLKAGQNQYVLTSREETDLLALGDFARFSISPLSIDEAFELIKLYDQNEELSQKLIERIKNDKQLDILKEFLTNPMLTSLLYKTFQYKEEIAYKKLDFYSQVYEALFNDHDKTKGGAYVHEKMCALDSTDFERLLRRIAFYSLKSKKVEFQSKAEVIQYIQEAITNMPWIEAKAEYVLYDLTHAVPFFQKDGVAYKWVHKSFMEYFSAAFICYENNSTEDLLGRMAKSNNFKYYVNTLDFCYEMKPEVFRKIVIYPFLCAYTKHCEEKYDNGYEDYEKYYLDVLKTTSYVLTARIHVYENREICQNVFQETRNSDKLFSSEGMGSRVEVVSSIENERILCAFAYKKTRKIYDFLVIKNLDIFYDRFPLKKEDSFLMYEGADMAEYIVNDENKNWYNSKENYSILARIFFDTLDGFGGNKNAKVLSYEKCVRLKNKIASEIAIQEQIEIDLD